MNKLRIQERNKMVILGGDFNLPHINWETKTVKAGTPQNALHQELLDITEENGLEQMQMKPSRLENTLDLYFTTNPSLVKSCDTIPGISDHNMIVIDSDIKPRYNTTKRRKIYQYKKANWTDIHTKMEELGKTITECTGSVQQKWDMLKKGIEDIMNVNIPTKLTSKKHNLPWITPRLRKQIRKKHKLFQKAGKSQKKEDWDKYRTQKRATQKQIRQAHWQYVNNILDKSLEEGSSKSFWKYIKAKRKDNVGVAGIKSNGILHQDSQTKAELLNQQFKSVFTKENREEPLPPLIETSYPSISEITIVEEGVEKLLKNLNVNKASGPDGLPNKILKLCARELAPAVTNIFQQSLDTNSLPDDWINANVSPIFKKGNKHLPSNYRPVSLTSVCCKLLEHIICRHVLKHLENHKILTNLQHGFRSGHSCESQLIITMQDVLNTFDKKNQIDMVILDFSKAFDTVPHRKLLHKLDNYGIRGNIHAWIKSFLTNRQQRVLVEGEYSTSCSVDSGVPQGTVLGPLLFLLHINDLPLTVTSKVRLFADDCLLYRSIKTLQDQIELQKDLASLEKWAQDWGMRFNATKCYLMSIHRAKNPLTYHYNLDNHVLEQVSDNPYLGVQISDNLKWSTHINKIVNKANSTLGFIRRNLKHCNSKLKESAYISLVRSVMDYASCVWDPHLQKDIDKIEGIQRRAARFVCNDYGRRSSVTDMMSRLNWTPLSDRRREQRLILLFKIINGLVAIPADDYIVFNQRRTRTSNCKSIKVQTCNTDIYKNSFFPRTINDWNELSDNTVNCNSVEGFKEALLKSRD